MVVAVLIVTDTIAGWVAFSAIFLPLYDTAIIFPGFVLLSVASIQLLWFTLFYVNGRYRVDPTLSRFDELQTLFKITLATTLVGVMCNELLKLPFVIPSGMLLQYWIVFVASVSSGRLVVRQVQKFFLRRGYGRKNAVIVGTNERARNLAQRLNDPLMGYNFLGYFTPQFSTDGIEEIDGKPVLGSLGNLKEAVDERHVSEVIVVLEKPDHDRLLDIMTIANGSPVSLKIIPDMYEVVSGLARTEHIYGIPLVQINPEIMTSQQRYLKRLIDLVMSFLVLVPLFPVWLVVAAAIKINSKGPIFYRQERMGQNGRRFIVSKFRSMVHNAESHTGPIWAMEDDPRITKVGKFLRRFRLDEMPQFINVLKGDMSVVGPRPERPYFVEKLMEQFPFYYRRYKIRPGITGWAQIKHSYDSTVEDVRQKLKYDFFYIENLSLSLDFMIMFRTAAVMMSGKGQ
ncbi:MAG: sugar transferase [Candidatus Neomarinimicrobiota bacterium]